MQDNGGDEYTSARKLVLRASKREAALSSGTVQGSFGADFTHLPLKPDHTQRPVWTCPDGNIFLEAFHDLYVSAYDFLVAIAEPVARPEFLHQYKLTPYSLYAAVATNIETEDIIGVLERLSKNKLPKEVKRFIRECTQKVSYDMYVSMYTSTWIDSDILRKLQADGSLSNNTCFSFSMLLQ